MPVFLKNISVTKYCQRNIIIAIFLILQIATSSLALEREMTVNIDAGKEDCFYQKAFEKEKIDIEYQVIDGGHGDLDITFHLVDPTGRILSADYKKSENNHRVEAHMTGDYKFCFDNTFSSYNSKTVFFELIIENENEEEWDEVVKNTGNLPEEVYELTVDEIQESVNKVRGYLKQIRHLQDVIKSTEARDRNIAEENYFKVNTFSWLQIFVMLFVGFVQVLMVKSLFDDKSKVHSIWKSFPKGS